MTIQQAANKSTGRRAESARRSPATAVGESSRESALNNVPGVLGLGALESKMNDSPHALQLRALDSKMNGDHGSPPVLQARLMVGGHAFQQRHEVEHLMANDEDIGWDDRWGEGIDAMLTLARDFEFPTPKDLETFLMNGIFPLAGNVDQPSSADDDVKGRLCFAYAALAAANITDHVVDEDVGDMEEHLASKNRYSAGGGASTAFRQMGMSPQEITTYGTTSQGVPTSISATADDAAEYIRECLAAGLPLTAGVRWTSGRSSGNHWVYIVGLSGNKVHTRDQQNGHVLGTIDMGSWTGESIDGAYQYTITKVAGARPMH